jgi:nucleotide-binding universal stress UspA family protein
MYKHILIPTDGSDLSSIAMRRGMAFAKSLDARVTVVTVTSPFRTVTIDPAMVASTPEQYRKDSEAAASRYLATATEAAKQAGVACEGVHAVGDHPYEAIIDTARAKGVDLIFMASHGRSGMSAVLLGSETTKVLTHSKIPVLVYRQ